MRDEENGVMEIIIHRSRDGFRSCDECSGEKTALCVKYCATEAIEIINIQG